MQWAEHMGIAMAHIQPGKLPQKATTGRFELKWLDLYIFDTHNEMQQITTEWIWP